MTDADFKVKYAANLNAQQVAAVWAVDGPVLLLAVPGSGKTTALVTRLGYMVLCRGIAPERILTMTYTVAATADMRSRFASLFGQALADRMEFRTINGVSARIIQRYERSLGRAAFTLVTEEGELSALVGEIYRNIHQEFATENTIKTIRTWITYIKNTRLSDEEIDGLTVDDIKIGAVYRAYCQVLRQRRKMDYDDQMVYALQILRQYPAILKFFQEKYPYLCVDEAQDTSKIQHQIIALLAGENGNLFMVGDEDQSIYGFRAAYPEALLKFDKVHPNASVLLLEQNYRSTPQIVAAADRFIQSNRSRRPKHMTAVGAPGPDLRAIDVQDRRAQYAYLEKVALDCSTETAVLYRNNDSALPLIDLMSRAGIAYRYRQFDTSFFTHRIVRDVVDILRFAYEPENGELFLRIYYKLSAGITKSAALWAAEQGSGVILDMLAETEQLSPWARTRCKALQTHLHNLKAERGDKAVYRVVHFMGYGDYLSQKNADTRKIPILEAIGAREPSPMRLLTRLEELAVIVREGGADEACPFILSTIHSSKGLEYERVFLMDVADNILPACPPVTSEGGRPEELRAYEEERRLFYVGMTRAKRELIFFRFRSLNLHSTFLDELFPKPEKPKVRASRQKAGTVPSSGKTSWFAAAKTGPKEPLVLEQGDFVTHKTFGHGVVLERQGDLASIRFDDGCVRWLSLSASVKFMRKNQRKEGNGHDHPERSR